jgi:hypothetical protein
MGQQNQRKADMEQLQHLTSADSPWFMPLAMFVTGYGFVFPIMCLQWVYCANCRHRSFVYKAEVSHQLSNLPRLQHRRQCACGLCLMGSNLVQRLFCSVQRTMSPCHFALLLPQDLHICDFRRNRTNIRFSVGGSMRPLVCGFCTAASEEERAK